MPGSELVYLGIKGTVVALETSSGVKSWETHLKGGGFVHIILNGKELFATTGGEIFCLNSSTGEIIWKNELRGLGYGLCSIATRQSPDASLLVLAAEIERQRQ